MLKLSIQKLVVFNYPSPNLITQESKNFISRIFSSGPTITDIKNQLGIDRSEELIDRTHFLLLHTYILVEMSCLFLNEKGTLYLFEYHLCFNPYESYVTKVL